MKKKPNTPRSKVRRALRQLWLRSRERAQALKNANYSCKLCKKKQSRAKGKEFKVEVHHIEGIDWDGVIDIIFNRILVHPNKLQVLCKKCHKEKHGIMSCIKNGKMYT